MMTDKFQNIQCSRPRVDGELARVPYLWKEIFYTLSDMLLKIITKFYSKFNSNLSKI